jgi:hypothetical protein
MRLASTLVLAVAAALVAPAASALAASPLTGETLAGSATITSAGGRAVRSCTQRDVASASATFNIPSGTATGPFAGSFVVTQGSASLFETVIHNQLSYDSLSVPFTITSGTTTIAGTITHGQTSLNPEPLPGFGFLCDGSAVAGLEVNTTATYTATIEVAGQAPEAISGPAHVSGSFSTGLGVQPGLTASFTG